MATSPKKTSINAYEEWLHSTPHSLPQDTDPARHPSPRFSSDTKGTHQTAEHHSLSRPRTLSGEGSDVVPGAFPDDSKRSRSLGRATQEDKKAPIEREIALGSSMGVASHKGEDEDLSLEALSPIPPPHRTGTDQPHLPPRSKPGDIATRADHRARERGFPSAQGPTVHTGSSLIREIEEVAAEVYHEAEHMLHDVGETVTAYFSSGKAPSDTVRDLGETARFQTKPFSARPSGPKSERTIQVPDELAQVAEGGFVQLPAERIIAESMQGRKITGNTATLPHTVQREYFRSYEYDLHGDRIDTGEFLFDDDESAASDSLSANDRDIASGVDDIPAAGSRAARRSLSGEDIGVGYGGVEYYLKGRGGILPGYPTPEGMRKLVSERMKDDRLREAGGENPSASSAFSGSSNSGQRERENVVRGRSQIVKGEQGMNIQTVTGPYSELVSEDSPSEISPESRIVGEKREVPVFVTGEPAAAGKYEAIFEPVSDEPEDFNQPPASAGPPPQVGETPVVEHGRSPTAGVLEEKMRPSIGSETARTAGSGGPLGGPITKEQEMLGAEKARPATSKN
ncbi:hypothetical protein M413DRAFT_30661 [Hebeloma cylindrosporum]|uniref:Uncharacterized protein n=1 Tax=Hebeloma cylindrosporum TaxID=76867 RepID=A0A0C3C0C4_HEBCY|nr:hypothetical protein M413DRAFT_30661 [Hebeloma cylindrosporum h7]